jgi:hypothetical protein
MVDRPVAEKVARGEARVARADNDRSGALDAWTPKTPLCSPSALGDFDDDVRGIRERVIHGGALLGLGDQRLDLLP